MLARLCLLPTLNESLLSGERFYGIQRGRILINAIDIRELNLLCIDRFSQHVFLFHDMVAKTIRYGSFDVIRE